MVEAQKSDIYLGYISSAHGIQGDVKFKSHTDLTSLKQYKAFTDDLGNRWTLKRAMEFKPKIFIVLFEEIKTRNASEAIIGRKIFIKRSQLKILEDEDEFYERDLLNLKVYNDQNEIIGHVEKFMNYGNNSVLEIKTFLMKKKLLVPFHKKFVKIVNIEEGFILLDSDYLQAFINVEMTNT